MIPNSGLRFTPNTDEDAPKYKDQGIWILKNKEPERIKIKTGISDGENIEIVSGKLHEGQEVIIHEIDKAKGQKSRPQGMGMGMR